MSYTNFSIHFFLFRAKVVPSIISSKLHTRYRLMDKWMFRYYLAQKQNVRHLYKSVSLKGHTGAVTTIPEVHTKHSF